MATAGPNSSGTITSDSSSGGTIVWVNPSNAGASDNTYATSSVTTTDHFSYFLNCQNFGFAIPAGSTINGILVEVERSNAAGGQVKDNEWYLIKAGSVIPTFPGTGSTKTAFPASDAYISYGGSSDLWGSSWTSTDINNSGFGFALDVAWVSGTPVARVDHVRITITYTPPAVTLDVATAAVLSQTATKDITSDAATTAPATKDVATAAVTTAPATLDLATAAVVTTTNTKDVAEDAAVSTTGTKDVAAAGVVTTTNTKDVTEDAILTTTGTKDIASDAVITAGTTVTLDLAEAAAVSVGLTSDGTPTLYTYVYRSTGQVGNDVAQAAALSVAATKDLLMDASVGIFRVDVATAGVISMTATADLTFAGCISVGVTKAPGSGTATFTRLPASGTATVSRLTGGRASVSRLSGGRASTTRLTGGRARDTRPRGGGSANLGP